MVLPGASESSAQVCTCLYLKANPDESPRGEMAYADTLHPKDKQMQWTEARVL